MGSAVGEAVGGAEGRGAGWWGRMGVEMLGSLGMWVWGAAESGVRGWGVWAEVCGLVVAGQVW